MMQDQFDSQESAALDSAMKRSAFLAARIRLVGLAILVVGILAAIGIYFFNASRTDNRSAYEVINGISYPVDVNDTKRYQYDMQKFGGKTAVLASDMGDWFSSLWHGKTLGLTIAVLSALLTLFCYLLAYLVSLPPHDDEEEDQKFRG